MTTEKFDIRKSIVDGIVDAMLTKNVVPWRMTWDTTGIATMPRNGLSKKPYRGVNVFHLWIMAMVKGYSSNEWFTYRQATELGGQVREGEKATAVIFWKFLDDKKDPTGKKKIPLARFYNVFNRDQIDGLPKQAAVTHNPHAAIDAAEAVIAGMKNAPKIVRDKPSAEAYYRPSTDTVVLPMLGQFKTPEAFYSTAFHELGHSTGHKSRLDRKLEDGYLNKHAYSKEELVAEMTAAFLCAETGILPATIENSTAYIIAWAKRLKEEPSLIHEAAGAAQRAADLIIGRKFEDKKDDEDSEPVAAVAAVVEPVAAAPVAPVPSPSKRRKPTLVPAAPAPAAPVSDDEVERRVAEATAILDNPNATDADVERAMAILAA